MVCFFFCGPPVSLMFCATAALSGLKGNYILNMTSCHRSTDLTSKSSDLTSQGSCICRLSAGNAARKRREFFTTERIGSCYFPLLCILATYRTPATTLHLLQTPLVVPDRHITNNPLSVERLHAPIKEGVSFTHAHPPGKIREIRPMALSSVNDQQASRAASS